MVNVDIKVIIGIVGVFVNKIVGISFVDGVLENGSFVDKFFMNVNVSS